MNKKGIKLYTPASILMVIIAMVFSMFFGGLNNSGVVYTDLSDDEMIVDTTAEPTIEPSLEPTVEPTAEPTVEPVETQKPEGDKLTDYERYNSMSEDEQVAFFNSFEDPMDFFDWYEKAQQEYEAQRDVIEIDGNTKIDMSEILG